MNKIKEYIEEGKAIKEKTVHYEVVLSEGHNFVIRKITGTKKELLVANFDDNQFYIMNEKTKKIKQNPSKTSLVTFFKYCNDLPMKNSWIKSADDVFVQVILPYVLTSKPCKYAVRNDFDQIDIMSAIGSINAPFYDTTKSHLLSYLLNPGLEKEMENFTKDSFLLIYDLFMSFVKRGEILSYYHLERIVPLLLSSSNVRTIIKENMDDMDYLLRVKGWLRVDCINVFTNLNIFSENDARVYFDFMMNSLVKGQRIIETTDTSILEKSWKSILDEIRKNEKEREKGGKESICGLTLEEDCANNIYINGKLFSNRTIKYEGYWTKKEIEIINKYKKLNLGDEYWEKRYPQAFRIFKSIKKLMPEK